MSQEAFWAEIYRENAKGPGCHLDGTPGLTVTVRTPQCGHTVWGTKTNLKVPKIQKQTQITHTAGPTNTECRSDLASVQAWTWQAYKVFVSCCVFLLCSSSLWRGAGFKTCSKGRKTNGCGANILPKPKLNCYCSCFRLTHAHKKSLGTSSACGFTMIYSCAWSRVKFRARFRLLQQFELQ